MELEQVDTHRWRIPRQGKMRVDGIVFADEQLMASIRRDKCLEQVRNVAHLPGIVGASLAMPDIHWATVSRSGGRRHRREGWGRLHPVASGTTSIEGCGCCAQV